MFSDFVPQDGFAEWRRKQSLTQPQAAQLVLQPGAQQSQGQITRPPVLPQQQDQNVHLQKQFPDAPLPADADTSLSWKQWLPVGLAAAARALQTPSAGGAGPIIGGALESGVQAYDVMSRRNVAEAKAKATPESMIKAYTALVNSPNVPADKKEMYQERLTALQVGMPSADVNKLPTIKPGPDASVLGLRASRQKQADASAALSEARLKHIGEGRGGAAAGAITPSRQASIDAAKKIRADATKKGIATKLHTMWAPHASETPFEKFIASPEAQAVIDEGMLTLDPADQDQMQKHYGEVAAKWQPTPTATPDTRSYKQQAADYLGLGGGAAAAPTATPTPVAAAPMAAPKAVKPPAQAAAPKAPAGPKPTPTAVAPAGAHDQVGLQDDPLAQLGVNPIAGIPPAIIQYIESDEVSDRGIAERLLQAGYTKEQARALIKLLVQQHGAQ